MDDFAKLVGKMGIRHKYLILLLLRSSFDAFRTWMLANLLRSVFHCVERHDVGSLLKTCAAYGLICALMFIYNGTVWSYYAAFSARAETWLQKKVLEKILGLPLKRIESAPGGEWITRLNSDIHAVFTMMNGSAYVCHLLK